MSLVITVYVREGIVMASDSRLTLNAEQKPKEEQDKPIIHLAVGQSDSNYKTFLAPGNIGISTSGDAAIEGTPIGGYIESFLNEKVKGQDLSVDQVAKELLNYFSSLSGPPKTGFHVAGYKDKDGILEQQVWNISVDKKKVAQTNPPGQSGAFWSGEIDIVTRLVQPMAQVVGDKKYDHLPHHPIPWNFFTLQDSVDFAIYAIRATIDSIRFQPRPKSVGGPIDVLVIKPDDSYWVQRKELHGETTTTRT